MKNKYIPGIFLWGKRSRNNDLLKKIGHQQIKKKKKTLKVSKTNRGYEKLENE